MRRLMGVVLTLGLLVGAGGVSTGQTPSLDPMPAPSGPAPSVSLAGAGTRFVLPEGGYAVTFPEGWEVQVHPVDWSPIPVVRAEDPHEKEASEPDAFCEVRVSDSCDGPCATLVDGWAAREMAWFESGTDVPVPSTVESVVLTLPARYAVRVRTAYTDLESDRSIYYLTDGRVIATLLCMAKDDPDDHWLSVAETLEFLPAEE